MTKTEIARAAHEINRAYCAAIGDGSQPAWEDAPAYKQQEVLAGVRLCIDHPPGSTAAAAHEAWTAGLAGLPREQQVKDHLFRAVVHALSR